MPELDEMSGEQPNQSSGTSSVDYARLFPESQLQHTEFFRRTPEQAQELPPPLPEELQTSRAELEQKLRPLEGAFIEPGLSHHGTAHGASATVLVTALNRIVPFPDDLRRRAHH